MKKILSGLAVAVCVLGASGDVWAQAPPPEMHVVVSYIKSAPGMQEAYREHLVNVSKKFYEELAKEQPTLMHWSAARVMFSGLENAEFDYVAAAAYAGPPPEPNTPAEALYQKASGMSRADYMKKLNGLRTVVATELLRSVAGSGAPGTLKEGDFRVANQLRIMPNMNSEWTNYSRTIAQPMMEIRRSGGELKNWSTWTRVFPAGAGTDYDALTVTYYQDLASAVKGLDSAKGAEAFAKAHPGKSYAGAVLDARDYAQVQNRVVQQLVALVERSAPAGSK